MIPLPNIMVIGPTGRGKTTAIRTLAEAGLETFVIFTEPSMQVVSDLHGWVHWAYVPPFVEGWDVHFERARLIQSSTWDSLSKQADDPNRRRYDQWMRLYSALANFTCAECGREFGDVKTWGHNRALVIDGLSGINQMSLDFCRGGAIGDEYGRKRGVAADQVYNLFGQTLCYLDCLYVLIGHSREIFFEDQRMMKTSIDILGKKTASAWARNFNDVCLAYYDETGFRWTNADANADVKAGFLPMSPNHPQSFVPLVEAWRRRVEAIPQPPQS